MKYHFRIYPEEVGYWAKCIEIEGCRTQGDTMEELEKNMDDVLHLCLEEPPESTLIFPPPRKNLQGKNIVEVSVRPAVALANRIRELRLKNKLTQHKMKDVLGIKHLSNYQRLEDPRRSNPQWDTLVNIKKHFPQFKLDDLAS
jgi:predicted RNase H-like HicB family nuclease/DNA-binding XRE family transcriptional regulator